MKIIIPVAGIGSRLRPHTHTIPKVLIKLAGKTIIEHILDELLRINNHFTEIIFIVGHLGDKIRKFVNTKYNNKINLAFVKQDRRKGVGHAVYLAREHITGGPIFIILGDTIIKADFNQVVKSKRNYIGVREVEDPRRFGIVFTDKKNNIIKFMEKPEKPLSRLAMVGVYNIQDSDSFFSKLEYIIQNNIKTKGEFQITDALQMMLREKIEFKTFKVSRWLDCGKPETLLASNRELLNDHHNGKKIPSAIIHPPVHISASAKIKNSLIGPYVSIGDKAVIEDSIIQNSIIDDNARIKRLLLEGSIIGNDALVKGKSRHLNIGDSSEVNFG